MNPGASVGAPHSRPVLLSYCGTFLLPEMKCIYRQVTGIGAFDHWVVARTRAREADFPFKQLVVLRKHPLRFLTRLLRRRRDSGKTLAADEVRQILQAADEHRARLLHVYLGTEALRVLPVLKHCSIARVVSFHGMDLANDLGPDRYARLWPHVEIVLGRSESLKRDLLARGCPPEKVRLNFTGVPLPDHVQPRALPAVSESRPLRLLQVCRLIAKKGLDVTLPAVGRLRDAGLPVRLTIAGSGAGEESLRQLTKRLGLEELVHFAGFVTGAALEDLFRESDVFVHPSRETERGDREGIPNSLLEAMSHGLPVVATRHSGIPEAVTDGYDGILIDHAEPDALASALQRVVESGETYTRLSASARHTVEKRFSIARCVATLEAAYHEALASRA